jgi:predicted RNA-binding protein YlqC (UPF0109 family)
MSEATEELGDLVGFLARSLVDRPEDVRVDVTEGDHSIVIELTVDPTDLGKVIGKDGRTARAIRTLLSAASAKHRRRAVLDILE